MILGSMATTNFTDSIAVEPSLALFTSDCVITSFPRHEVVKLTEETYMQWQQQVKLILDGYDLLRLLDGTLPPPARFVQSIDGSLVPNPSAQGFKQQDQFLTSWLLSTISAPLLPSFTDANSASDVWTTVTDLFATDTGAKQSRLHHELHSLKKGNMSIHSYVARIKNLCALLKTSSSQILEEKKVEIILSGLLRPVDNAPPIVGPELGQIRREFGQPLAVPYRHRPLTPKPTTNNVQVDPSWGLGPNARFMSGVSILWHTKPRARVYSGSDPCIGLPHVGDFYASDFSDTFGSHVNTA
ncbi:hypothetical protein PVK06_018000 [Gossypium arboreum]|uniref:Retrotransposon Copia-like N-terminal domain-containing protein n=1 Tax=Gossypium arboreum TaxID=29729 RepID=A0ABR0Q523_GOSAR|nr:hypothetical protein PVK06_018000 [Gossypium arboreum]